MVVFQGASSLSLDAKGRLSVPTRHRDVLSATAGGQLTITKHPHGCLMVFPRPEWEKFRERIAALPMSAQWYWNRYADDPGKHGPAKFEHLSGAVGCDFLTVGATQPDEFCGSLGVMSWKSFRLLSVSVPLPAAPPGLRS